MTTYFGECNSDGSLHQSVAGYDYGGPNHIASFNATYQCPGSGTIDITSLGIYARSGGTAGDIRLAIYDTSWNLICQWTNALSVSDDTPAWRDVVAADMTGTKTLTGGTSYRIAYSMATDYPRIGYHTEFLSGDWKYEAGDYSAGGFPASLSEPNDGSTAGRMFVRVGLQDGGAAEPAYGYATPDAPEVATSWTTWHLGSGAVVTGDADYGTLSIPYGIVCASPVIDMGDADSKTITVTCPKYGSNSGSVTKEYRGSATTFAWDAGSPSWSAYSAPVAQSWRYFQVRLTGA